MPMVKNLDLRFKSVVRHQRPTAEEWMDYRKQASERDLAGREGKE